MTGHDDIEILARFHGRLAGIEHEVPDPPAWPARRVRGSTRPVGLTWSTRRGLTASAAVVAIVVIALLAVIPGLAGRTPSTTPPARGASPSLAIVIGSDGLPTSIGAEPVLSVPDALSHALATPDATTFLVGGWLDDAKAACPMPFPRPSPKPTLLDTGLCGTWPALVGAPTYDSTGQPTLGWNNATVLWTIFLAGSSPPEPSPPAGLGSRNLAVVLRVHTHDPTAATCPQGLRSQCDAAVVVNSVEWLSTSIASSPSPESNPTPTPAISFGCSSVQLNGPSPDSSTASWCPVAEVAVETAVADLGYPIQRIVIAPTTFPCGVPWPSGYAACPPFLELAAFVTFAGTDQVAALTIATASDRPPIATLVAFQVPPAGWSMP